MVERFSHPAGLAAELSTLPQLDLAILRNRWRALYGTEAPPYFRRRLLIHAVAYKLQEQVYGGLKPSTRRLLMRVAADLSAGRPISIAPNRKLKPGTRLLRDWRGVTHEVIILDEGVLFRGERYRSLSEVARLITGAHWSGPRFFGLHAPASPNGHGHDQR